MSLLVLTQGRLVEGYRNLLSKSIFGLRWAIEECPWAHFVLKTDDDMFINVPAIQRAVETLNMKWSIMGEINPTSPAIRGGKWKATIEQFPFEMYPTYLTGTGYVMSADVLRPLFNASEYFPYLYIEDVYLTGILRQILNINPVAHPEFNHHPRRTSIACEIVHDTLLTQTFVTAKMQRSIWRDFTHAKCR